MKAKISLHNIHNKINNQMNRFQLLPKEKQQKVIISLESLGKTLQLFEGIMKGQGNPIRPSESGCYSVREEINTQNFTRTKEPEKSKNAFADAATRRKNRAEAEHNNFIKNNKSSVRFPTLF